MVGKKGKVAFLPFGLTTCWTVVAGRFYVILECLQKVQRLNGFDRWGCCILFDGSGYLIWLESSKVPPLMERYEHSLIYKE